MTGVAAVAAGLIGCAGETPPPPLRLDGEPEIVRLGPRHPPRHLLSAHRFERQISSRGELLLAGDYVLEFLPLLVEGGGGGSGGVIDTSAVVDGVEQRLASSPILPVRARSWVRRPAGERLDELFRPARVDLSELRGRRVQLRWTYRGGAAGDLAAVGNPRLLGRPPPATNDVLFICSDTHRFDYAFGAEGERLMPNLQRFRQRAVLYRQAYSNASWTMPALASTLTGLFPRHHLTGRRSGVVATADFRPDELPLGHFGFETGAQTRLLSSFPRQLVSLPERLQAAGYRSVLVVSNPLYSLSGLAFEGVDLTIDTGVARADSVNGSAVDVIRRQPRDRPLFLLVHYMDVHQWRQWYLEEESEDEERRREQIRSSYAEAVGVTDRALGSLLEVWDEARPAARSIVVFFSDHGEHLLEAELPQLGHGNSMADHLLHVPLAIRYPDGAGHEPGEVSANVSLVDLAPTVLDLLELPYEADRLSGRSLARAGADQALGERPIFADYQLYGEDLASVRRGDHKLVIGLESRQLRLESPAPAHGGGGAEIERSLRAAYREYVERARAATEGLEFDRAIVQEEARQQLEALGYIR